MIWAYNVLNLASISGINGLHLHPTQIICHLNSCGVAPLSAYRFINLSVRDKWFSFPGHAPMTHPLQDESPPSPPQNSHDRGVATAFR